VVPRKEFEPQRHREEKDRGIGKERKDAILL
jgi:hypothetical protein